MQSKFEEDFWRPVSLSVRLTLVGQGIMFNTYEPTCELRFIYCHVLVVMCQHKDMGLGLVTEFIGQLQFSLTLFLTLCSSLQHAPSLLGLLSLHQTSGTGFQRRTFPFMGSRTVPVPRPQQLVTHRALNGNSIVLAPLHSPKSSFFWSCYL
jgi:hypothetical protein